MRLLLTILISWLGSLPVSGQPTGGLKIFPLTNNCCIFTTWQNYKGNPVPANGMYLVTKQGVVIFDTPWDTTQCQPLLDSIQARHNKPVLLCLATHSHADRTGGFAIFQQKGIRTYTTKMTDSICRKTGERTAAFLIEKDTTFTVGEYSFETYYPGQGHTPDNIIIWLPSQKVIYGGCLVKSTEATDLGNLADANVSAWTATIQNIQKKYRQPRYIIPGHGSWASNKSLQHTIKLVKQHRRKK